MAAHKCKRFGAFVGRYAKATLPAGLAVSQALGAYVATGVLDRVTLGIAAMGFIASIWVALVPNAEQSVA